MRIQKVSQIELVEYIDSLDNQLNNVKARNILYNEYLHTENRITRKTKTDKRYKVIAALVRDNFNTQIGDTTVWRVLKVKQKSKKVFEELKSGDVAIKEAYNKLYGVADNKKTIASLNEEKVYNEKENFKNSNLECESYKDDLDILRVLQQINQELVVSTDNHINNKRLREIDDQLFTLRKTISSLMKNNDAE